MLEGSVVFSRLMFALFALLLAGSVLPARAGESTFERVMRTKVLRVTGIQGEAPYYTKDKSTGEWSGIFIDMAKDMADSLGAKMEVVETASWGSAILDLQTGKTDVHFGVNPNPKRGLVLDFSHPVYINTFNTICRPGVKVATWDDLDKPDMRIAVDIGSSHEFIARKYASKAQITGYKTRNEVILAVASQKADCFVMTPLLGLDAIKKNPGLGTLVVPKPVVYTISPIVLPKQTDKRMMEFINVWIDYNKGLGQIRDWIVKNLASIGIQASDIPPEVQF
jgi:polar amino acid transport system substrate-binding protein